MDFIQRSLGQCSRRIGCFADLRVAGAYQNGHCAWVLSALGRAAGAVVASTLLAAAMACSRGSPSKPMGSANVRLVAASAESRRQCADAATRLGFAVPCPTRVPTIHGRAILCPATRTSTTLPPCVGLAGLPSYAIFDIDFAGFDVGSAYVGVDGKPVGHMIIEASPLQRAPDRPCIGVKVGSVAAKEITATEYRCSNDALLVQREARHGEGAHLGHLLLAWDQNGVQYVASAHGYTTTNLMVLERLIASVRLVTPGR